MQRRHTFDVGFYREGRKAEPLERAQSSCSGRSGPVQRRGSGTKGRRGDDETIGGFARTTRRGDDSLVGLSKRCAGLRASFAIPSATRRISANTRFAARARPTAIFSSTSDEILAHMKCQVGNFRIKLARTARRKDFWAYGLGI